MKSLTKSAGAFLTAVFMAFSVIFGSGAVLSVPVSAASAEDGSYKYYYQKLAGDQMAERFYGAFETLVENGDFKKGKIEFDLVENGVASGDEVAAYVNGTDNNKLVKAYGKGRDAFYMDHPDLFYADVFSTSVSAGQGGGKYVAYLDSSRVLTTYRGEMNSEEAVNAAIEAYNGKISEIVTEAKKKSGEKAQIEFVNEYIAEHNTYGYGTRVEGDRNVDTPKAAFIYTSYGALVNNESVCEGYAKSFKAVMDRLDIPCVCVQGYADGSGEGNYEPHMWNYVEVEGMWYAVDVTYNATSGKNKWILVGEQSIFNTHIEDGSVSTSDYELEYPALKPYDYGKDSDENGMTVIGSYTQDSLGGKYLNLVVSYDGKGARVLEDEGKYLAYRLGTRNSESREIEWNAWLNVIAVNEALKDNFAGDVYTITDFDTKIPDIAAEYVQFAIFNRAPDSKGTDLFTSSHTVAYDSAKLQESDYIVRPTAEYQNNGYRSYIPSPGAAGVSPANTGDLPVDRTYDIRIVYNTKLEIEEDKTEQDVGMDYEVTHGQSTVKEHAKIENFRWDGDRTITFTFTPSRMYIHNAASYYFTPTALVGAESKKTPDPVVYTFKGKSVVCSKVFNDGRLYMSVYGQPTLLDNSDLSVTDFKDDNGKYYAESQRSQLVLVASKPSSAQEKKMDEVLKTETGIKNDEIVSSSTYEIDLQICGGVRKVPNGSYMQVAFGFPEGYDKNDAGTTFKIYHYKHDDAGNITGVEEIPVIVTEYGLIAKVSSFSPFTVVQVKNTSAAVQNGGVSVYAYVNGGTGGTITADGKSGICEITGESITYDITPDEGFAIACVRLNGKVIDASYYRDGKLTLAKKDIEAGNTLEVQFVNAEIASAYAAKGVSLSYGMRSAYKPSTAFDAAPSVNAAGIISVCVTGAVAFGAVAFLVWWFSIRGEKASAGNGKKQSGKSTKNTTSKKK